MALVAGGWFVLSMDVMFASAAPMTDQLPGQKSIELIDPSMIKWSEIDVPKNSREEGAPPAEWSISVDPSMVPKVPEQQPVIEPLPPVQPDSVLETPRNTELFPDSYLQPSPSVSTYNCEAKSCRSRSSRLRHCHQAVDGNPFELWKDYCSTDYPQTIYTSDFHSKSPHYSDYLGLNANSNYRPAVAESIHSETIARPNASRETVSEINVTASEAQPRNRASNDWGDATESIDQIWVSPSIQTSTVSWPRVTSGRQETVPTSESKIRQSEIIVHPPLVQPYRKNQYTFVVENRGDEAAHNVIVQLDVSEPARVFAALPSDALLADRTAVFRVGSIAPNGHVELHVGARSDEGKLIEFKSSVSVTSKQNFSASNSDSVAMHQVGATNNGARHQLPSYSRQPTSETKRTLPGGSEIIRNPFFDQDAPTGEETGYRTANLQPILSTGQPTIVQRPQSNLMFDSEQRVVINFGDSR